MMFTTMLRGTLAIWCSSSPTSGTGSISRSSSGLDCDVAVQRLQPLGMRHRRRQQPREIVGDVHAADRQLRGVQQLALGEHRHAGGAAAHVDDGGAELALVLHQGRKPGGHRRGDQLGDIEVAARDAGAQRAQRGGRRHR